MYLPQFCYTKGPDTKDYIVYDPICMNFSEKRNLQRKRVVLVVAWGRELEEKLTTNKYKGSFGDEENQIVMIAKLCTKKLYCILNKMSDFYGMSQ